MKSYSDKWWDVGKLRKKKRKKFLQSTKVFYKNEKFENMVKKTESKRNDISKEKIRVKFEKNLNYRGSYIRNVYHKQK